MFPMASLLPLRWAWFVVLCCAWLHPALAQEPAASASFEPAVGRQGRPVEYCVKITGDQRVLELPNLVPPEGFEFQPSGSSYRLVQLNGQIVGMSMLRFLTVPARAGEFTVPAFDVEVGDKRVRVPAAKLTVNALAPGEAAYQPLRVVLDVPARDYYVGETISGRLLFIATPDESAYSVQHISKTTGTVLFRSGRSAQSGTFVFEGKPVVALAMPIEITPLVEGDSPITCEAIVQVQKLDPLGRRSGFVPQSTLQSSPARIRVVALPKVGRPPGFTGAIGQFSVSQPKLSSTEIEAGEPVTLSFALTGEGNLDAVPAPELGDTAEWTAYKPMSEFSRSDETGRATKTFTYTLVPKREGRRGTPPLPFAYFDPVKKKFEDITIPPIPFLVKAAPGGASAPGTGTTAATDAPPTAAPAPEPAPALTGLSEKSGFWFGAIGPSFRFFFLAQIAPPVLLLLAWAWRRRREYLTAHPEILLRRRARAAARRALSEARAAARRDDVPAFLRAGAGALCEAAARLETAQPTSLTPGEVLSSLEGEAAVAARAIFDHADATRYASAASTLPKLTTLLPGLENAVAKLTARA
jgi:hypothetical protein